jgi:hypothetical protein
MLQLDFLESLVERFLATLCWSRRGDGDCPRDCSLEMKNSSFGLCILMGKRVGQLESL